MSLLATKLTGLGLSCEHYVRDVAKAPEGLKKAPAVKIVRDSSDENDVAISSVTRTQRTRPPLPLQVLLDPTLPLGPLRWQAAPLLRLLQCWAAIM
jgi:hypothetical protein